MKKSKLITVLCLSFALLTIGGVAQASQYWVTFDKVVPSFNGNAFTSAQTVYSDLPVTIDFDMYSVGGDYTVDVRSQRIDPDGVHLTYTSWIQKVGDNESWEITPGYIHDDGTKYKLEFSSDLFTPVDVEAYGDWTDY